MSDDHAECQAALNTARRQLAEAIDAGARQAAGLQADNDRLRAALQAIADGDVPEAYDGVNQYLCDDLIHAAREALATAPKGNPSVAP